MRGALVGLLGGLLALAIVGCADDEDASVGASRPLQYVEWLTPSPTSGSSRVQASPASVRPAPQVPVFFRIEVREGDTVESIAQRFALRPESIRWNNEALLVKGELQPGTLLEVPPVDGVLHRVRLGETLSEIAARYGVAPEAIASFPPNGLGSPPRPPSDGVILVPGGRRPD